MNIKNIYKNQNELIHTLPGIHIEQGMPTMYYGENFSRNTIKNYWYSWLDKNYWDIIKLPNEKSEMIGNKGFKSVQECYNYTAKAYIKYLEDIINLNNLEIKRIKETL